MRWSSSDLTMIDEAIAAVRAARPAVVSIIAEPGFGKSTLLREAASRLAGFHLLRAVGEESTQDEPLQLVEEWAEQESTRTGLHVLQAARALGLVVDRLQVTGPVAIVVDDLQWIDRESVDALAALIRRAAGDRLLMLVAHRPLHTAHASWTRLEQDADLVRVVRLTGLDAFATAEIVSEAVSASDAGAGEESGHASEDIAVLAEALRVHTGGSPLLLRALLAEHDLAELAALADRGELPAPAGLAASIDERMSRIAPDAARMLRALAVLGDAWADVPTAAAVGGVVDAEAALGVLTADGLVRVDRSGVIPHARISHAVTCAAVYGVIPADVRRGLHSAAAARAASPARRLRHRALAARTPDEGLAHDLVRHAGELHGQGRHSEESRWLRLAAAATPDPRSREARELEADLAGILARDGESLRGVDEEAGPKARLVAALGLTVQKKWVRAARVMDGLTPTALAAFDPVDGYRARVLRGWTIVAAGRDRSDARAPLEEAARSSVVDAAFGGYFTFAYGQVMQAAIAPDAPLWGFDDVRREDRATLAATADGVVRLSWRGAILALTGASREAVGDLSVVTGAIADAGLDFGDGVFHALLGFAQWQVGEWRRAAISLDLSSESALGAAHPLVAALTPLSALATGRDPRDALAHARAALIGGPLVSAVQAGDIAEVGVLAYTGTPDERSRWLARRTADFGPPARQGDGAVPYLWVLAIGIGAAWAGDGAAADAAADALDRLSGGSWRETAVAWLRALAAGTRGDHVAEALATAARRGLPGLPAFEAILWADAATAAAAESAPHAADVRARALAALDEIGAGAYADAMLPASLDAPEPVRAVDPLAPLSDREREVVELMLEGLSYAQIAKELYITRGTVAFHLSNAYAKTATSSRHDLVQLVRAR